MGDKEDFATRLTQIGSNAFTSLSLTIGSQLGLFDVFSRFKEPATSTQIAAESNLKERYVREWLGVMVCSKIVEIDEKSVEKYWLPEERYKVLTGAGSMAVFLNCLPILGKITPDILDCFKVNGPNGLPYSKYVGFHEWRQKDTLTKYSLTVLQEINSLVPGLPEAIEKGTKFCDIGCSTGHVVRTLADCYPKSTFYGYDISPEAVQQALSLSPVVNVKFAVMDLYKMPTDWTNKWEFLAVYDVIHDLPYPDLGMREILRVLKPGGYFLMVDLATNTKQKDNIDHPWAPILYGMSLFHCMPVSLYFDGGMGLGSCWGRQKASQMLKEAGFNLISNTTKYVEEIYVCQKPA